MIEGDRGRSIADITHKFEYEGFEQALEKVLSTLGVVEAAVQCGDAWYVMRILPYRSIRHVIEGVIVTFANVTQLKDAQRDVHELSSALKERLLELRTVLDVLPIGIAFVEMPAGRLGLELQLAWDLPEVKCNPTQIEQVVVNLIRNAFEASSRAASVRLSTERAGNRVRLSVEDDGPGIAPEQLQKIFDPFYSTRRNKGGTGLGLSIAHRVITDHGGTIQAFNRPEGGARFVVELPVARDMDDVEDSTKPSEASDGESSDSR